MVRPAFTAVIAARQASTISTILRNRAGSAVLKPREPSQTPATSAGRKASARSPDSFVTSPSRARKLKPTTSVNRKYAISEARPAAWPAGLAK